MPRTASQSGLERTINNIVNRAASEVAEAVRQNIADEVTRLVGSRGGATLGRAFGRKRRVILCPVPNCGKPGGGPKWGWFCAEHKDLSAAEKEKARNATRARPRGAAAAKASRKKK
jgi:hypothetical protein